MSRKQVKVQPEPDTEEYPTDKTVKIPDVDEYDINLVLPGGKKITVQYRDYDGEDGATSIDVLLPEATLVYNWKGSDMKPAMGVREQPWVRCADQLMFMIDRN